MEIFMLKEERQKQILSILRSNGHVAIDELCQIFNVSNMTIRRDLDEMEAQEQLIRSHGGALLPDADILIENPFYLRLDQNKEKKKAVAAAAADFLSNGQKIFIGSGTTTHYLVQKMDNSKKLLVVTDAINISQELVNRSAISVLQIGGDIRSNTLSATGIFAENMVRQFRFKYSFMGVTGIGTDGQLYVGSVAQLGNYQAVLTSSEHIVILADSSKLGNVDFISVGNLSEKFTLITNSDAESSLINAYKESGANVILS
jgi:DeoR/GlpR family transcriptional regulator of sugar metabolism